MAQSVKNLHARQEAACKAGNPGLIPGSEIATHSSILAWRISWTKEPGRLQSMGSQESEMTWQLNHHH